MTARILILALIPVLAACAQSGSSTGQQPAEDAQSRAQIHTELGAAYYGAGQYAVAIEELEIALSADPDYVPAINQLGLVHLTLGQDGKAQQRFERALRLAPDDPSVNNNYGMFLCERGRERDAMRYFAKALENPLYRTPEVAYVNAGLCARSKGDEVRAEEFLRKALSAAPDQPQALFNLAEISYRKADIVAARAFVTRFHQVSVPSAESLWLAARIENMLGNRNALASYGAQLNRRFPEAPQTRAFNEGNFQ
ncbi:MAG: type IV pilus biogenesis/stability protein PilW [Burkholderiales bacterium]